MMDHDDLFALGRSAAGERIAGAIKAEYGSAFRPYGMAAHAIASLTEDGAVVLHPDGHVERWAP